MMGQGFSIDRHSIKANVEIPTWVAGVAIAVPAVIGAVGLYLVTRPTQ